MQSHAKNIDTTFGNEVFPFVYKRLLFTWKRGNGLKGKNNKTWQYDPLRAKEEKTLRAFSGPFWQEVVILSHEISV